MVPVNETNSYTEHGLKTASPSPLRKLMLKQNFVMIPVHERHFYSEHDPKTASPSLLSEIDG